MICPPLVPLAFANAEDRFGSKASNLAHLLAEGVSTPQGVVLGTDTFEENLDHLGVTDIASRFFRDLKVAGGTYTDVRSDAELLRQSVLNCELDPQLVLALSAYCEPDITFAVRSSAPGEDGFNSSFAGQFDSILDCRSVAEVSQAVRTVWSSLFGERAVTYALHRGQPLEGMAIIVQQQVNAAASGVMFTRDPRKGENDDILVEYCAGLGERLVSGQITPGRFRIERAESTFVSELEPNETVAWTPQDPGASKALAELGLALERRFGGPQDVEWSVDHSGQIYALQSRPITTLPAQRTGDVWSNANIGENFPEPICPMVRSFVAKGYAAYFRSLAVAFGVPGRRVEAMHDEFENLVGVHGGRLYYNLSNIHALLYAIPWGPMLGRYFNQFTGAKEFPEPDRISRSRIAELSEAFWMLLHIIWRYSTIHSGLRTFEVRVDEYAASSDPNILQSLDTSSLSQLLQGFVDIRLGQWTNAALADAGAMISYGLLGSFLGGQNYIDGNDLLKGLPGLASAAPVEQLWDMSRKIRKDEQVSELILNAPVRTTLKHLQRGLYPEYGAALHDYLDKWGFRSSGELMLVKPTPKEDPLPVLRLLKTYVATEGPGPAEKSKHQAGEREEATRNARRQMGPVRGTILSFVLRMTQASIRLRERARMKQALLYTRLRHVALALGEKLVECGELDTPEDVFFLELDEAISLGNGRGTDTKCVNARRAEMAKNQTWAAPDSFVLPKGEEYFYSPNVDAQGVTVISDLLSGLSACGGQASGTAAVVLDVSEIDRIRKDQILVTRQTDPGWASVFFLVKGLVIERGGLLSHGAIIAREYGIPAVVDVEGATKLITDGDTLRIQGDQGRVQIVRT